MTEQEKLAKLIREVVEAFLAGFAFVTISIVLFSIWVYFT